MKRAPLVPREYDKKVKRIIRLYDRLYTGHRIYPPDMAEEFGVSLRSIQRDLADMQEMHLPISTVEIDKHQHYMLMEDARKFPACFGLAELIVVILALRMMQQYEGTGLVGYLADLAEKISDRLNQTASERAIDLKRKLYAHQMFPRNYTAKEEAVDDILTALIQEKKLKLRYQPLSSKAKTHVIHPYCLLSYKSGLYLLALIDPPPEGSRLTVFALERVLSCERLDASFELPADWKPEDFLPELGGLMPGKPEKVKIEFSPDLRVYLENLRLAEGGRLSESSNKRMLLKATMNVNEEFIHWIIGFGASAKVLSPPSLVERIKKHLTATLAVYK